MTDWLTNLKYTMSLDVGRFIAAQWPPRAIVEGLFEIPEVRQAFHLRENRLHPLAVDPGTDEQRQEIVDAHERVADWLDAGGSDERIAQKLREIAEAVRG